MNSRSYYAYKFFKDTIPIYPVYLLLFESKGLSLGQISLLLAIWSVPVVLLEIPTGILADHWNRKNLIVFGSLFKAACYVLWFFSDGFALYALGFISWGIGEALCSGSEEALLYDSLKGKREEECFDKVYGTGNFFSGLGVAVSCFAGGILAEAITYEGVLAVSAAMVSVSALFALSFREINYFKAKLDDREEWNREKPLATLKASMKLCINNQMLLLVILMLVLAVGAAGILDEYDPLVADSFDLRLSIVGIWIGFRYLLEAIGSRSAYLIKSLFEKSGISEPFHIVFALCLISGASLAIFGFFHHILLIFLYGFFYLLMASAVILQEDYVQKQIEEHGRSTVHSIISLMQNLYGILFFAAVSLISRIGIQWIISLSGVYIILVSLILFLRRRAMGTNPRAH